MLRRASIDDAKIAFTGLEPDVKFMLDPWE